MLVYSHSEQRQEPSAHQQDCGVPRWHGTAPLSAMPLRVGARCSHTAYSLPVLPSSFTWGNRLTEIYSFTQHQRACQWQPGFNRCLLPFACWMVCVCVSGVLHLPSVLCSVLSLTLLCWILMTLLPYFSWIALDAVCNLLCQKEEGTCTIPPRLPPGPHRKSS